MKMEKQYLRKLNTRTTKALGFNFEYYFCLEVKMFLYLYKSNFYRRRLKSVNLIGN